MSALETAKEAEKPKEGEITTAASAETETEVTEEENSTAEFRPVVQLEDVEVQSGEEDEEVMFCMRGKLFRFGETLLDQGTGKKQWIERGVGEFKVLKHRETEQQRMLMRQDKTMKLILNTLIDPRITMTNLASSERAWVWSCFDYSENDLVEQVFCFRCASVEDATKFKESFEAAQSEMKKLLEGADAPASAEADEAAEAIGSLSTTETAEKE